MRPPVPPPVGLPRGCASKGVARASKRANGMAEAPRIRSEAIAGRARRPEMATRSPAYTRAPYSVHRVRAARPLAASVSGRQAARVPFVIFVCPMLSANAIQMMGALSRLPDVRAAVIMPEPAEALPAELRAALAGHWRVDNIFDTGQLAAAARELAAHNGPVHRIFGAFEQLQVQLAEVRVQLGIEGMSVDAAHNFRDKARMKDLLRRNGIPCARAALATTPAEALAFAARSGYPVVVKPPAGAGAVATFRADSAAQLTEGLQAVGFGHGEPLLVEEFVQGTEHSCESITIGGTTVWQSITRYAPTPLDVKRNPWIQWCVILPREQHAPAEHDIRDAAARALSVLGMQTGLSHLEWFRRTDGSIAISEVAARPPGAQITTLVSRAHDFDFVEAWVRLMVHGTFAAPPRRYAVGAAYLRGQGSGPIRAIHGLEVAQRELGPLICDLQLPVIGHAPRDTYEGDGFVLLRHPDTAVVERGLLRLISTVRVELG